MPPRGGVPGGGLKIDSPSPKIVTRLLIENINNYKIIKACSNQANMLVQRHPTLLDATCWPRLSTIQDVG